MSLFKKHNAKPTSINPNFAQPQASTFTNHYPIEVTNWNIHIDAIKSLVKACEFDLNEGRISDYIKCKLVPEPNNENDPNAIKVYGAPKGRGKEFFDIGYIPSERTADVRKDMKKVEAKSHFWSIRVNFDIIDGIRFDIYLKESKF